MYEVRGDGPYFIYDKEKDQLVSMISFRTQAEADAFVKMFDKTRRGEENDD